MFCNDVRIRSTGIALPGEPVDNARLARAFGLDQVWEQWIDVFVGTRSRYLATDLSTGERFSTLAELAATAAGRALDNAGIGPGDVDLIVMATATPDMLMPATVNVVADTLGINDVPTFQLQSGCTGAVQALEVAARFLATGSRTVLVLGGDTCAKHLDTAANVADVPPAQLVNLLLFGDAAAAVVLGTAAQPGLAEIRRVATRLTGLGREAGQTLEWYGLADRDRDGAGLRPPASENYKAIEESVPRMAGEILTEMLAELGWSETDFDYLLPPQLSGRMTDRIVTELGVPTAQPISCVTETGNTGNALPFLQLDRALAVMQPGDRALGIAVESSKWIKGGFAFERV